MAPPPRKRLGELLVEAGVLDEQQLRAALGHQRQWGGKLGQALVDLKLALEPQIVAALSTKLGYDVVQLDRVQRTAALDAALKLVPGEVARRDNILPLAADTSSITLAMSDPTNVALTDEVSFRTGRRVKIVIAGDREVSRAVSRLYFPDEDRVGPGLELQRASSAAPLNRSYDALSDHMQQRFFKTQLRDLDAEPAAAANAELADIELTPEDEAPPAPAPAQAQAQAAPLDAMLRDALDRMALGEESPAGLAGARLAAAAVKALLKRGLVTEAELLAELSQPRR